MYLNIFYVHTDFFMLFPNIFFHKNVYSTKIFTFFLLKNGWLPEQSNLKMITSMENNFV